ncbi:MAG: aspartate aminotransferase family protein [Phycisphaerae bacterium]
MAALIDTYAQLPIDVVSGHGSKLVTRDGRKYWDLYGGHAVAVIGHSHPAVADAISRQARELAFYSNVVALDVRTRAAERLVKFAGGGLEHVFLCNSGAEANENALKIAIQQTGRKRLAVLEGGWHGRTLLALSATTEEKLRIPVAGLLVPSIRLGVNAFDDLHKLDESIAAIIVEPIESIAGCAEVSSAFLAALRKRCDEVGAYLIYDEIQTGMGRLGRPFVAGWDGVCPDISTSAKGIANGVPCGATLMNARVASKIKSGDLGSTFGGSPIACAAMLATLDVIEGERLCERAAAIGERVHRELVIGPVKQIHGRGCLIGLRCDRPAKEVQTKLLSAGFIVGTSADSHVARLMPPINLPEEAITQLAAILRTM